MNEKNLVMVFEGEGGKKFSLSVKDVNLDASKPEIVNEIMDYLLTSKVILANGNELQKKLSASVVTKETTDISIIA